MFIIVKNNNEEFIKYCKNSKIDNYILENNNKYLDILLGDVNFKKRRKDIFPVRKTIK